MIDIVASEGHVLLLQARGRINVLNADEFEVQARRALAGADRDVIIDASNVTYLGPAGLRVLLHLWQDLKKENRTLHIRALRPYIQQVFEMVGFDRFIPNQADVAGDSAAVDNRT